MASEADNEHDDHMSPDQVVPTFEVELTDVEEALLKKLPFEGENQDKKKCGLVCFEEMIGQDEYESGRWLQVSQSVYGICALIFVQLGAPKDIVEFIFVFFFTFLPCLVIGFVQGYLVYKLLENLHSYAEASRQTEDLSFAGACTGEASGSLPKVEYLFNMVVDT